MAKPLSPVEQAKLKKIMADPVLWAKAFLIVKDPATKKYGPWIARDYQAEVLRNRDIRKVYRWGRRLGKSECLLIDGLWQAFTRRDHKVLYVTPYENQVNDIFNRLRRFIDNSPLVKKEVTQMKSSPYTIKFKNGSTIMGFTTGASSGGSGNSIRGQAADWIFADELDYMGPEDYSTISAIANEREDIGITTSSTPTGKRGTFYRMCTDPSMGYTHWHIPSQRSPLWTPELEARARAERSAVQYEHEVLAEFGTEEMGVFAKDKVDAAARMSWFAYEKLDDIQTRSLGDREPPELFDYSIGSPAPQNMFRCVGVDWDQYQASSSIVVLDFDINFRKFRVLKRIEVPRAEYSIDNAVNWVIKVNEIYNPSWIFCDRGYGELKLGKNRG